jgi:cell wall-associated NlpC family hydrolase
MSQSIAAIRDCDIPVAFWNVPYDGTRFAVRNIGAGANCQAFAYAVLRHFGRAISDFRSSELWNDTSETETVSDFAPLDLLMFNGSADSYGAHVGVYLGDGRVIHLSRRVGKPAVWPFERFARETGYEVFIGAKRVRLSAATGSS